MFASQKSGRDIRNACGVFGSYQSTELVFHRLNMFCWGVDGDPSFHKQPWALASIKGRITLKSTALGKTMCLLLGLDASITRAFPSKKYLACPFRQILHSFETCVDTFLAEAC